VKFLVTGLPSDVTEDAIKVGMVKFGTVTHVEFIAQGQGSVWAIMEMPVTHEQAFQITQRMQDFYYGGRYINVRILNH